MKKSLLPFCLLFSFYSSFAIDIQIDSVTMDVGASCFENGGANFHVYIDISNANLGETVGGDSVILVGRDGLCNIFITTHYILINENDFDYAINATFPAPFVPESRPFTFAFYDAIPGESRSFDSYHSSIPLASIQFDPVDLGECTNLPLSPTACPVVIPTIGEWGLGILSLSLLIIGIIFLRKKVKSKDLIYN